MILWLKISLAPSTRFGLSVREGYHGCGIRTILAKLVGRLYQPSDLMFLGLAVTHCRTVATKKMEER